ncbi:MAG: hypothetical protein WCL39_03850 [Armatimonadota bacterium]
MKPASSNAAKYGLFTCLGCFGVVVLLCAVGGIMAPSNNSEGTSPQAKDQPSYQAESSKGISGVAPVDVYLNMEKQGFTTKKDFSNGKCMWSSSKTINMTTYGVDVYSSNVNTVERVNAMGGTTTDKDADAVFRKFLGYVATLQYEGSQPEVARQWVESNIGSKGKMSIGGVTFEIDAPAPTGRWLSIYKQQVPILRE